MKQFVICALFLAGLSGCMHATEVPVLDRPIIECLNPDDRKRLSDTATVRDLTISREEALAGWSDCYGANTTNIETFGKQKK